MVGARKDKRGRLICWCGGYWFPHRKAGGACDHSKTRDIHMALRMKDEERLLQALVDFAFLNPGALGNECPF